MLKRGCYNEEIPYHHFRLVLLDGAHQQVRKDQALALAAEADCDVMLVKGRFGQDDTPVCRLVDRATRARIALAKRTAERKQLFKQKAMERMKTVRIGARADANSLATKGRQMLAILQSGTKVRVAVIFKAEAEKRTRRVLGPKVLNGVLDPLFEQGHGKLVGAFMAHGDAMMSAIVEPSAEYKAAKSKRLDAWKDRKRKARAPEGPGAGGAESADGSASRSAADADGDGDDLDGFDFDDDLMFGDDVDDDEELATMAEVAEAGGAANAGGGGEAGGACDGGAGARRAGAAVAGGHLARRARAVSDASAVGHGAGRRAPATGRERRPACPLAMAHGAPYNLTLSRGSRRTRARSRAPAAAALASACHVCHRKKSGVSTSRSSPYMDTPTVMREAARAACTLT